MPRLVDISLALPLFQSFTYAVPADVRTPVTTGTRVLVPFRNRRQIGIVLGDAVRPDPAREYKEILEVPDDEPALDESMLRLARWIAGYYAAPLGLVIRSALPALLTGAARPVPPRKTHRVVRIRDDLPTLMQRDAAFRRAPRQRELFELLESLGGAAPVEHLTDQLDFSSSVLDGLVRRALVTVERVDVERDPFAARALTAPQRHEPTPAQRAAIDAIAGGEPGATFLLHGITGSGKTLVYLEVLRRVVIERGQSAIVLVPEIALTPQTVDRFRAVFGERVAVLHSALSDGERYDAWRALRRGERTIAVGARSAVFAPLANLGAIIVDEEHEASYKQGESPRYHAREVAIVRARQAGAVVVLGSATPSLESWSNAKEGRYNLLQLPDRVGGGALPKVRVVDLRERRDSPAASARDPFRQVVSGVLEEALRDRLDRGEQSILLLNRRGFSAFVQCTACGDVAVCPDCSISLTYHR
ncbi:MAG TPA: primosomal protein N', partial [Gemmatimonadaceae bacterium]|nr:primosomal protein N' [Gemmatimonadaceae bacterium]